MMDFPVPDPDILHPEAFNDARIGTLSSLLRKKGRPVEYQVAFRPLCDRGVELRKIGILFI